MSDAVMVQGPLLIAIVIASLWGSIVVPRGERFPIRFGGASGFQTTIPRSLALVLWPAIGIAIVLGVRAAGDESTLILLGAAALLIVFVGQVAAIRRAAGPPGS